MRWKASDLHNTTKAKAPKPVQKLDQQLSTSDVQEALSAITINRKADKVQYDKDGKHIMFTLKDGSEWRVSVTRV